MLAILVLTISKKQTWVKPVNLCIVTAAAVIITLDYRQEKSSDIGCYNAETMPHRIVLQFLLFALIFTLCNGMYSNIKSRTFDHATVLRFTE